jgi:hypothetical protein
MIDGGCRVTPSAQADSRQKHTIAGRISTPIDNNASSIVNYSTSYVRAYADSNYTGAYIQLLPYGHTNGTLSYAYSSLGSLNESLSSHKVAGP